jgi:hypothetical protein
MSEDKELYQKPKSHIKAYWVSWIVYIIILFLIKDFFKGNSGDDAGAMFGIILFPLVLAWGISEYENLRFMNYLKENHLEKWVQITTVFGYSGGHNWFKTLEFILSSDDLNDPMLKYMKSIERKFTFFFLSVVFSMPVILIYIFLNLKH